MAWRILTLGIVLSLSWAVIGCPRPPESEPVVVESTETAEEEQEQEGVVSAVPPQVRYVYLEYRPDDEEACLRVDDPQASISRSRRPYRVEWQAVPAAEELQWVIEYDEAKGGEPVLPGRMVIPCALGSAYRSPRPTGTEDARWTYRVSVFRCENGRPGAEPACVVDPEILIWK